jgi:hypothetical protein
MGQDSQSTADAQPSENVLEIPKKACQSTLAMPLLVTSASGTNGNGFGALLAFELDGTFRGTFIEDDRIADPRGLAVDPKDNLLFLNSGADRVLAISADGLVVRDTGRIEGLNPGGGILGRDGRYFVGLRSTRTIIALSGKLLLLRALNM